MAINANANGIPFLKRTGIPPAIKNSMVVYYDIKKQGCTNESMKANPKLIDLSGNGHDAVLNNFAWKGMSGIGGYNINIDDFNIYSGAQYSYPTKTTIHISKVKPSNNDLLIAFITEHGADKVPSDTIFYLPPIRFKVTGIQESELSYYVRGAKDRITITISDGVEYYFEGGEFISNGGNVGFEIVWNKIDTTERDVDITVELLPLYPNALVFDGVDDYGVTENIPIFMPEVGFTVIAKRKILDTNKYCVASCSPGDSKGAFLFELGAIGDQDSTIILYPNTAIYSFGKGIHTATLQTNDISYMKSNQYNDITLTKGSDNSTAPLIIGRRSLNNSRILKGAIYSLMLFNRDLTTEEIEFVKQKYFSD